MKILQKIEIWKLDWSKYDEKKDANLSEEELLKKIGKKTIAKVVEYGVYK